MEPMDVLEVLLLMIAMRLGILEIAVGPWAVGKEPTGDREADKGQQRRRRQRQQGYLTRSCQGGDDDGRRRGRAERVSSWAPRGTYPGQEQVVILQLG